MSASITALPASATRKPLSPWQFWGRVLVAPYVLVFLVFVLYPVCYGLWLARHPASYVRLIEDPIFFRTALNTVVFLVVAINLKMLLALALSGFFVQARWWIKVLAVLFICRGRCRRSPPSCRCVSCSTRNGASSTPRYFA
jgi:multiple sugar transport system permease protein